MNHLWTRVRLALAVAALAPLSSCGESGAGLDEPEEFVPANVVGTYQLVSVNGITVPNTIEIDGLVVDIASGGAQLNGDFTCSIWVVLSGGEEESVTCTYTLVDHDITLVNETGHTATGKADGETLSFTDEDDVTWVFRRVATP